MFSSLFQRPLASLLILAVAASFISPNFALAAAPNGTLTGAPQTISTGVSANPINPLSRIGTWKSGQLATFASKFPAE